MGKSTLALNLALGLQHFDKKKVGLFDADIYGPSLPVLLNKKKAFLEADKQSPTEILPVEFEGLKTMSFGFAAADKRAVLRGPMVSSIVSQLFYVV